MPLSATEKAAHAAAPAPDKPAPAPGPYDWTASAEPSRSGFHVYLVDANGRKIAAIWGKEGEKAATAAFLARAPMMLDTLRLILPMLETDGISLSKIAVHVRQAIEAAEARP